MIENDFFEEDEPVEKIRAIFERGEKGVTERGRYHWAHSPPPGGFQITRTGESEPARRHSCGTYGFSP